MAVHLDSKGVDGIKTFANLVGHLKIEDTVTGAAAYKSDSESSDQAVLERRCGDCEEEKVVFFCAVCNFHLCSECEKGTPSSALGCFKI